MKLKDVIATHPETSIMPNRTFGLLSDVLGSLGIYYDNISLEDEDIFNSRVTVKFITKWYDNDTHLGTNVFFFDDIPFLLTIRSCRKDGTDFYVLDPTVLDSFILFAKSLSTPPTYTYDVVSMDEDLGEGYSLRYGSEVLSKYGYFNNERVKIAKIYDYPHMDKYNIIGIEYPSGEYIEVNVSELQFKFGE
jgi:hypothetical protein